jgi:Protein of unknown function (DUF2975)
MKVQKISLVAVFIVPFAVLLIFFFNTRGSRANNVQAPFVKIPDSDTAFGGIFFEPIFPENLSSSQYKKIEKDFRERKEKMKITNEGKFLNGLSFGFVGVLNFPLSYGYEEIPYQKSDTSTNYYFSLSGYEFKENETKFYMEKGTYNLAYVQITKKKEMLERRIGEYFCKKIDIRYSSANKRILIPITKSRYEILRSILKATIFLLIGIAFYFFIGLPLQILLNISRGKAFCLGNIKYLKQMIFVACIFYVLVFFSPYLFQLIFMDKIPTEIFYNSFSKTLGRNIFSLLFIFMLFLIKKAFEKGYNLQEENALTV